MKRKSYFVIVATCVATWASTQAQGPSHREEEQESRFSQILTAGKMVGGALIRGSLEVVSQHPLQVFFGIALPLAFSWFPEGEACGPKPPDKLRNAALKHHHHHQKTSPPSVKLSDTSLSWGPGGGGPLGGGPG